MTEQERIMQTVLDYFEGWYDDVDRWHEDVDRMARSLLTLRPARPDTVEREAA
jgi:hypothetical protein